MIDEYWIKEALKWCDAFLNRLAVTPEHNDNEYVLWLACKLRDEEDENQGCKKNRKTVEKTTAKTTTSNTKRN